MPDANYYLRQANALLSMSLGTSNPVVAAQLWEIVEDYLVKAVRLGAFSGKADSSSRSENATIQK
jgi:hypothetical protein